MGIVEIFNELKHYVNFDDHDLLVLTEFHKFAFLQFDSIASEFYERTREHEEAHVVFKDEEQINRLHVSLVRWMHRVCTHKRDADYVLETAKIGHVHVKIGLPQRYVLSAMSLIRVRFEQIVQMNSNEFDASKIRIAIAKALDLEVGIILEAYRDHFIARIQKMQQREHDELGRALAQSQHRYINAVELAPFLMIGINKQGAIVLFNQQAECVTGMSRDEVWNTPFAETLMTEETRHVYQEILDHISSGSDSTSRFEFESDLPMRNGKLRHIHWNFAYAPPQDSIRDPHDDVVIFAIGYDKTVERTMEERTRQAEKLAAVGTLAAGLAHEIRNPLNGALLHVTFLERTLQKIKIPVDPDILDSVQIVGDEIKRLSKLVNEFLDFARPRPLNRKPAIIHEVCERAVQLLAGMAEQANVKLILELAPNPIQIYADAERLEQVLLNLMRNAIEALAATTQARLIVRTRRSPRHIIVEVEDNGPGIPSRETPIFDAFFSTKSNGTGLGLPIVHRIVTDHGGTIDVESKVGRTMFRVVLPIHR